MFKNLLSTFLFVLVILIGFVWSIQDCKDKIIDFSSVQSVENQYNSIFSSKSIPLDLYSASQRALGKHETRNFEVLRSNDNQLYLQESGFPSDDFTLGKIADQIKIVNDATLQYGGRFDFVQAPYKSAEQIDELQFYQNDKTCSAENTIVNWCRDNCVDTLDLREYLECNNYYKTDHHWTVEAAYNSASHILEYISKDNKSDFDDLSLITSIDNYDIVEYKNSLLGSLGVKVGPYFVGKDDVKIPNPNFKTNLSLKHFVDGSFEFEYSGDFWKTFIDESILNDSEYYNKYNSLMHGAWNESIILNNNVNNDTKVLLISHSYGRALVPYISLAVKETRYLDPQKGRFNDSIIDYIKEYEPDYVIYMYNDLVVL